jgi:hypothetical protein
LRGVFGEEISGKARPNVGDRGSDLHDPRGKRDEFVKLVDEVLLPGEFYGSEP